MSNTCSSCEGTGRLYTSGWDDEGFPCPQCRPPAAVRLLVADTGEVCEWRGEGDEDGGWRQSSLQLALNLVPQLEEAIDRARIQGRIAEVHVR